MYSYEDRIRAVKLYIKLGKRAGATIRQFGYPTKNSLKSWHEQYEQGLDLSRGYVRAKPKYSQAQRRQAVQHHLEHGRCIAFTIKALGYPSRDLLRAWIRETHPELHGRFVGRSDSHARSPAMKQAAVIALCRESLAGFKTPKRVIAQDEALPRTPTGKVQKFLLVERYQTV